MRRGIHRTDGPRRDPRRVAPTLDLDRSTLISVRPDLPKSLGELCSTDRYIKNRATSIGLMCEPGLAGSLLAEVATMTGKDRGSGWERGWPTCGVTDLIA